MSRVWRTVSDDFLRAAERNQISFLPKVQPGHQILDTGGEFEATSQHPDSQIMPLGAYSYSLSSFGPCTTIGRYCSIGRSVSVFGDRHPIDRLSSSPLFFKTRKFRKKTGTRPQRDMVGFATLPSAVTIGHDVWIGDDATLKDGLHIGDGAVIAACSVVTRDVPPYTIVGGNPAKKIRLRFPQEIVEALFKLEWWQYDIRAVQALPTEDIEAFLREADALDASVLSPEVRMTYADLMG